MHRSGTSVLARITNLLGVDIGPSDQLLEALPQNPRGFWENAALKDINEKVLKTVGGGWDFPPIPEDGWAIAERLDELRGEAIATLNRLAAGSEFFLWKDPRNSLTLPFWRSLARIEGTLHAARHPSAVASSLEDRNQMDRERASALWLRYTASALVHDPDALLIEFDDWFEERRQVCTSIVRYMGLSEPSSKAMAEVDRFIVTQLRHHTSTKPTDPGPMETLAVDVYSEIIGGRRSQLSSLLGALAISDRLADPDSVRRMVLEDSRGRIEESRGGVRHWRAKFEKAAERGVALRTQRDQVKESLRSSTLELKDLKKSFSEVSGALEHERAKSRNLEAEVADLKARTSLLNQRVAELARSYDRLQNRRVVRLALRVARLARPIFRIRRRGMRSAKSRPAKPPPVRDHAKDDLGRAVEDTQQVPTGLQRASSQQDRRMSRLLPGLEVLCISATPTIVIPVYGALAELMECIASVLRNTYGDAELLVIDDASPQPQIGKYLRDLAGRYDNVRLEVNESNLGFVKTVNKAFGMTTGDVVVVNSDTQVPPRWLNRMRLIAYSDPTIGTVTPLSNNAGAFSAPVIGQSNTMPLEVDDMGRLITHESEFLLPSTPTANGFCMYVKREVIGATGGFDADSFPRGYGEENDFSMRAAALGWRHVVDDSTFVFHSRSASFQEEKADLLARGRAKVHELHPEYGRLVKAFVSDETMMEARQAVERATRSATTGSRGLPRILYVVHGGGGGTIMTNADLMRAVSDDYEPLLLSTNGRTMTLRHGVTNEVIRRITLEDPIDPGQFESSSYRETVGELMVAYGIEIVHIRHLQRHTFDLPSTATALSIPVVLSFHDFYYCCPTVHLLDEQDRFCGGSCTPGQGHCRTPRWFVGTPHLKHGWVNVWQERSSEMFKHVDAFVTTSASAVEVYQGVFPQLRNARFEIIEHGRDIDQQPSVAKFPTPGQPARILLLGHVEVHKGAGLIAELQRLDQSEALEFHLLGNLTDEVALDIVDHGTYRREEFARIVAEIEPAVIALLSIWPETYSHTLTEAWSAGIPVVASRLGALGERIERHGGGWTVDIADPERVYEFLVNLFADKAEWEREREKARVAEIRTVSEMSTDYLRLYSELSRVHRTFRAKT